MKIIFLIEKTNYYRNFTPLIKEGLNRRYDIECWHNYSKPRSGQRWYSFPETKDVPAFDSAKQPKVSVFYGNEDLKDKLKAIDTADAVISLHAPDFYFDPGWIKEIGLRWFTLLAFCDILFEPNNHPDAARQNKNGIFFLYSEYWLLRARDFMRRFHPRRAYLLEDAYNKYVFTGIPEFDAFKNIDPNKVRKKYGIPEGKSILLYLPFPYSNRSKHSAWEMAFCGLFTNTAVAQDGSYIHDKMRPFWENLRHRAGCLCRIAKDPSSWECLLRGLNEPQVFKAARKFCDKNDLYLVAKPRLKFPVSQIVRRESDLVVWDDEKNLNPPVLKELLSISKLTVSFFSFSVLSSVFAGVFHLNASLSDKFCDGDPAGRYWLPEEEPSFFNFKGACESWKVKKIINELNNADPERFKIDPQRRKEYIEKYIGQDDFHSSARFFDALEKNI